MTSRAIIVEQVKNQLAGGKAPANFPITDQEIGKKVDQITNDIIAINCMEDILCDDYCLPFEDVEILLDAALNKYYCVLPAAVISLPRQKGVWQVSSMQDQSLPYVSIGTQGASRYKADLADLLQGNVGYYYQQGKLFFENYNPALNTTTLLVKLIVDRSYLEDEDSYCVPGNIEKMIVEKTFETFPGYSSKK